MKVKISIENGNRRKAKQICLVKWINIKCLDEIVARVGPRTRDCDENGLLAEPQGPELNNGTAWS